MLMHLLDLKAGLSEGTWDVMVNRKLIQLKRSDANALNRFRWSFPICAAGLLMISCWPIMGQETSRVRPEVLKAVVKLTTSQRKFGPSATGTGFLVQGGGSGKSVFLVTNKHVLGDWNCADGNVEDYYDWIDVFFYRQPGYAGGSYAPTRIELKDKAGVLRSPKIRLHSDPGVDLAMIALDTELAPAASVQYVSFDTTYLIDFQTSSSFAGVGALVFALGYPLGITSLRTNYPIAKAGYISSQPGEELVIPFNCMSRAQKAVPMALKGKLILVDGLIVAGNSGGPVVLEYGTRVRGNPATKQLEYTTEPVQNLVLGLVSSGLGPSGLTIVVSSDYIKEMMNSYHP